MVWHCWGRFVIGRKRWFDVNNARGCECKFISVFLHHRFAKVHIGQFRSINDFANRGVAKLALNLHEISTTKQRPTLEQSSPRMNHGKEGRAFPLHRFYPRQRRGHRHLAVETTRPVSDNSFGHRGACPQGSDQSLARLSCDATQPI